MKRFPPSASRLVIVFIRLKHQAQREKMSGIYSAATRRGWQVLPLDEPFSASRLKEIIRLWKPIGCLIDASAMSDVPSGARRIEKKMLCALPCVLLGRDITRRQQIFDLSVQDTRAPVDTAVRNFRELGLGHFGFFGYPGWPFWSLERGQHLKDAVRPSACPSYAGSDPATGKGLPELAGWLRRLPKPVGILLATDHLALTLYAAARRAGREIGSDLVVIGVDNDEQICNSLAPTLTSVRLDYFGDGENAIDILQRRIEDPDLPIQVRTYGTLGLVSRSSTARRYPDARISAGLAVIRERSSERISTADVATAMKCGRRMAEKLFAKHLGQTILGVLRRERIEKAKTLLRDTHYPIDAIPGLCGYRSLSHLKTTFRQETGQTMRDWRRTRAQEEITPTCR